MSLAMRPPTAAITVPPAAAPTTAPPSAPAGGRRGFAPAVALLDVGLLVLAFAVAHVVRFPWELSAVRPQAGWIEFATAPVIILVWMALLSMFRTRDPRIAGIGSDEYRRLVTASLVAVAVVAVVAYAAQLDLARGTWPSPSRSGSSSSPSGGRPSAPSWRAVVLAGNGCRTS
ncbi:hypothetical protein QP157_01275 [Sphingomonas sp. LR61]|uniref:hypothetical protein n=1 Tax=Sphingomonas sp. LR61 TaxID=3050234 RepID=UPI002FE13436